MREKERITQYTGKKKINETTNAKRVQKRRKTEYGLKKMRE